MTTPGWQFIDENGTFQLPNPDNNNYLYFPLLNEAGMMSAITPNAHGDAKSGQNSFLLQPVSVEDLHTTRLARNFWVKIDDRYPWSATGNSADQTTRRLSADKEEVLLTAGLLWQTVRRADPRSGLQAEVTNFVPAGERHQVELMRIVLKNTGNQRLALTPTAAIPIYGRSADNLRDHRHVTSLLHRTHCHRHGILVRPTLSFDERGHLVNTLTYAVLGAEGNGRPPVGFFPLLQDFIGEGGTLDWPAAVVSESVTLYPAGASFDGYESLGGLRFADCELAAGQAISYILILGILQEGQSPDALLAAYASDEQFERALAETQAFWRDKISSLAFETGDDRLDGWLKWVALQPVLRRMMGNSFLPYHDYGRGGRGWRDLWQDALALLLTESGGVAEMLWQNFAGVRMDGSNATIIGSQPGEFKADRNGIPRVWMDHGAWPLLTVKFYLDQSGDLEFLLREQVYFRDHLTHRCHQTDPRWRPEQGLWLQTVAGDLARGSLLEHLLVQHLTAFHHVGQHNLILLEGGDWNDALDMASRQGESVAFSALYAANLRTLSELCLRLAEKEGEEIGLAEELTLLLDLDGRPADYASPQAKRQRLQEYFDRVAGPISGRKRKVALRALAHDLQTKADWLAGHIRRQEWIPGADGFGWFNGYYDDEGRRVEGEHAEGVRMTLTGQVFPLMGGIASREQVEQVVRAADRYLYDESVGGYRLNTDFGTNPPPLGRMFGFAFGHKENGAMFSHMAVMYAYALYRCGRPIEAWRILEGMYRQSQDFDRSRIYPGLPEYFDPRGRGRYPYLTGSAAWYLFTLLTEAYGVRGRLGDLCLAPRLTLAQFGQATRLAVHTVFAGKRLEIEYRNPLRLEVGEYDIVALQLNGEQVPLPVGKDGLLFCRQELEAWPASSRLVIELGKKESRNDE
ncbi:MAG: cellobiose phosphorylase [Anaerolineales bacterium]